MNRNRIKGIMIHLGHDKSVLSDAIIAVEPLTSRMFDTHDTNGNKLRSRVLIDHAENEILASRTAQTILKDMTEADQVSTGQTILKGVFDNPILSLTDFLTEVEKAERNEILKALNEHDNVKTAIESLPYQATKFYKLVKKYEIDMNRSREAIDSGDELV